MAGQSRSAAAVFSFAMESARAFHAANPWFDNRKRAAYANVGDLVPHPNIHRVFDVEALGSLKTWNPPADDFVLKADSGHSAKWVWPLRANGPGTWTDQIRQLDHDADAIRELARLSVTRTRCNVAFAEAMIMRSGQLAPDYKFYVSAGCCVLMVVVRRTINGVRLKYFNRKLEPLPLMDLFAADHAVEEDNVKLANGTLVGSMMEISEKLARRHQARFCRYDFLLGDSSFFFGEISPVCGAMLYLEPTDLAASLLIPDRARHAISSARDEFRARLRTLARTWIKANASPELTRREAYWRFVHATDSSSEDLGFETFLWVAKQAGVVWLDGPPQT